VTKLLHNDTTTGMIRAYFSRLYHVKRKWMET